MPVPLAAIGIGVMAVGAIMGSRAAQKAAEARAKEARAMAREMERMAGQRLQEGAETAFYNRMKGAMTIGSARTAFAKSNTDAEEGPIFQSAYSTELASALEMSNARRAAWGLQEQAKNLRQAAAWAESAGETAALASLLSSAGSALSMYSGSIGSAIGGGITGSGTASSPKSHPKR